MRNTFTILLMALALSVSAQTMVDQDPRTGNYKVMNKPPLVVHDSTTANTITDSNGDTYPVYVGPKGGIYWYVQDSLGNWNKRYLRVVQPKK